MIKMIKPDSPKNNFMYIVIVQIQNICVDNITAYLRKYDIINQKAKKI